jgi:P27 family predicted phage terminase small subunit
MMDRKPAENLDPPEHLSEKSKSLWRELVPARAKSPGRIALLAVALEAKDRADEARELVKSEGMISQKEGSKMLHVHPALKIEKDARSQFLSAWNQLSLCWDGMVDGR